MEVHLSAEAQLKLATMAAQQGRDSEALVAEAIERMLDDGSRYLAEVEKGLAQIESGRTLSHEEVGLRLQAYLSGKQAKS